MASPSLSLYLLAARRAAPGPRPALPPAPQGAPVVWFDLGARDDIAGLAQLARRMRIARPGMAFLLTATAGAPAAGGFPEGTVALPRPADRLPDLHGFLDHFDPGLVVLAAPDLPPALIHAARARGLPVALVDLELAEGAALPWRWSVGMAGALLRRLGLILARDRTTERGLMRTAGPGLAVHVTGRIEATYDPPDHDEAERSALAGLIEARPVWHAVDVPEAEEEAVLAAHAWALRFAHRALLILAPESPARAPALVERLERAGFDTALRSADEDPTEDIQVLVADVEGESGLWFRLAPVTLLGGTLAGAGARRSPAEPAALGSAILHGPQTRTQAAALAELDAAGAAWRISTPAALAEAVADAITPDRAARLALNAWKVVTKGAEVRECAMQLLFERLDAARRGAGGRG